MDKTHTKINAALAIFVFLSSVIAYLMTMGPSICLWDCGEYLASSASLGIPHPPGTPLLVMIGRVFDLALPFIKDPGFRVNLLASLGSALVVMFVYLIIVRALIAVLGAPTTAWRKISIYCGGVIGALFCAYSNTFWFCSLEASEQCNACLLPVVISIWLTIMWAQSQDPHRDRLLLLVAYIGYVGVGMHMISMITLPVIFLYIMMIDKSKREDWRLWIAGLALSSVMYNLSWFMVACPIVTIISGVMAFMEGRNRVKWQFVFLFSFLAIIGFSNHIYMPVRSHLNPSIDEDHPATWQAFTESLDRKQYGSESMVSRSFWRRGTLAHQFGIEGNMGYGGFHLTQFFHLGNHDTEKNFFDEGFGIGIGKLLVYLIPTFFMFFGWGYVYKRNKNVGVLLIGCTIITTLILAWYMNFADGTRSEHQDYLAWVQNGKPGPEPLVHREVRVRDYFFNAGFMFFGMWIGLAAGCLLTALSASKNSFLRTTVAPIMIVLLTVSPVLPLTQNYSNRDRHRNFLPYDYAYNLLMSCAPDAIIFTNGDNDTFPLWAAQEAFGIRKDVRLINLSLLNTKWYIKQLKTLEPKVPITFSDAQIDELSHDRNPYTTPVQYTLPEANITVTLPTSQQQDALRIQDKMVLNIVDSNRWRKPVYFAGTVSDDNFMGLGPYLQMQGMVFRIMPKPVPADQQVDVQKTLYLADNVYRFRDLRGPGVSLDEPARGLLSNYAALFIEAAFSLKKALPAEKTDVENLQRRLAAGHATPADSAALSAKVHAYSDNLASVMKILDKCIAIVPDDWRPRVVRHQILVENGMYQEAEKAAKEAVAADSTNLEYQKMLAEAYQRENKLTEANLIFKKLLNNDQDPWYAYFTVANNYSQMKQFDSAIGVVEQYRDMHPGDRRADELIANIQHEKMNGGAGHATDTAAKTHPGAKVLTPAG